MPSIHARLDLLRRLRRPLREAALALAIAHATPEEADALAAEMIEQARDPRHRGLLTDAAAQWPRLSPSARRALAHAIADRLPRILADLSSRSSPDARRAPIQILADLAEGRAGENAGFSLGLDHAGAALAALAEEDLADPATVDALARVVLSLPDSDARGAGEVDRILAGAARAYDVHRCPLLMDAVLMRAAHPGPALRAWLEDHAEPGHLALRAAVRRLPSEEAERRLVPLMGVRAIAGACVERLEKIAAPRLLARTMPEAPLLESRHRRAALRRLGRPETLLPDAPSLASMPLGARLGYLRWVSALPLRQERRLELLATCASDADPRVRLACVRAMARLDPSPSLDEALAQCAADLDPRVASAAASSLDAALSDHRRAAIAEMSLPLVDSPHATVRAIAARIVGPVPPADPDGRRRWFDPAEVRRGLARTRDRTLADLRAQIASGDRASRVAALGLVARLGIVSHVRGEVVSAARSEDPFVAAKAARALASLREPGARIELSRLIEHKDARVRADAIESLGALGSLGEPEPIDLAALAENGVARVRANTLRAMLRAPAHAMRARGGLAEMLADQRPEHRRSALWVVQRSGVTSLADRVAEIVRSDPDETVRARARLCGRRLLAAMRRDWAERAPDDAVAGAPQGAFP